mmetsp:Transcript_3633/g.7959  ORF Transcript_3633/g.7959 Transcript_3633/m.7959 type:complete len:290 (+) Transcript_3633:115-984(+)
MSGTLAGLLSERRWQCSFCGCMRNVAVDSLCRLCRRPRASTAGLSPRSLPRRRSNLSHVQGLQALSSHKEGTSQPSLRQAYQRPSLTLLQNCVVCYELSHDRTDCCGQPLCTLCRGRCTQQSLPCPLCRRKLYPDQVPSSFADEEEILPNLDDLASERQALFDMSGVSLPALSSRLASARATTAGPLRRPHRHRVWSNHSSDGSVVKYVDNLLATRGGGEESSALAAPPSGHASTSPVASTSQSITAMHLHELAVLEGFHALDKGYLQRLRDSDLLTSQQVTQLLQLET